MNEKDRTLWQERMASPLTWHYVGVGVLAVLTIILSIRVGLDWAATDNHSTEALADKQMQLKTLDVQTAPLRGLDGRIDKSRTQIKEFLTKRIPANYSSISNRIGELEVQSGVRLSRVQYTQGAPGSDLTEISIDAGISGDYPQIMRFINSLERDRNFFVIRAMTLTGQQAGLVNLRLRVSTWLRPADAAASGLPATTAEGEPNNSTPAAQPTAALPGKEGE